VPRARVRRAARRIMEHFSQGESRQQENAISDEVATGSQKYLEINGSD